MDDWDSMWNDAGRVKGGQSSGVTFLLASRGGYRGVALPKVPYPWPKKVPYPWQKINLSQKKCRTLGRKKVPYPW